MSNITKVEFKAKQISLSADKVLEEAKDNYGSVIVIGYDKEGCLDVRATNNLDQKECLYMTQKFITGLMVGDYDPE